MGRLAYIVRRGLGKDLIPGASAPSPMNTTEQDVTYKVGARVLMASQDKEPHYPWSPRICGTVTGITDTGQIEIMVPGVRANSNWTRDPSELHIATEEEYRAYSSFPSAGAQARF